MTRSLLIPACLAVLPVFAGCGASSSVKVGEYSSARVHGSTEVVLAGRAELSPGEVRQECDDDAAMADLHVEVTDQTLTVRYDGEAEAGAAPPCTVTLYGDDLRALTVTRDDSGETMIAVDASADLSLDTMEADRVHIAVGSSGSVSVGSMDASEAHVDMSGGGSLTIDDTDVGWLSVELGGNSSASFGDLDATHWDLYARGTADVWADGRTESAYFDVSGDVMIEAEQVTAEEAEIRAGGSAEVSLTVTELVTVDATGNAAVEIGGDPADSVINAQGSASVELSL